MPVTPQPGPPSSVDPASPLDSRRAQWADASARSVRPSRHRVPAIAFALTAVAAMAVAAWLLSGDRVRSAPPVSAAAPSGDGDIGVSGSAEKQPPQPESPGPADRARERRAAAVPAVAADCPSLPTATLSADVDSDGCPEPVRYAEGVVEAAGRRWQVGEVGDQVAVGDWWCTGQRTLAVLRPSDGILFAFPDWARAGADLTVTAAGTVPGGRSLRAADVDGDGCHELAVERDGQPTELVVLPEPVPEPGSGTVSPSERRSESRSRDGSGSTSEERVDETHEEEIP